MWNVLALHRKRIYGDNGFAFNFTRFLNEMNVTNYDFLDFFFEIALGLLYWISVGRLEGHVQGETIFLISTYCSTEFVFFGFILNNFGLLHDWFLLNFYATSYVFHFLKSFVLSINGNFSLQFLGKILKCWIYIGYNEWIIPRVFFMWAKFVLHQFLLCFVLWSQPIMFFFFWFFSFPISFHCFHRIF